MFTVTNDMRRKTEAVGRKRRKRWTGRKRGSIAKATTVGAVSTRSSRRKWRTRAWKRIISRRSRRKQRQKSATNLQGGNRKRFENRTFLRIARRPLKEGPFSPRHLKFPSNLSFLIYYHFFFSSSRIICISYPIYRFLNVFEILSRPLGDLPSLDRKDSVILLRIQYRFWDWPVNNGSIIIMEKKLFLYARYSAAMYRHILKLYFYTSNERATLTRENSRSSYGNRKKNRFNNTAHKSQMKNSIPFVEREESWLYIIYIYI